MAHAVFGVGGLIGPFIVYFFSTKAFIAMGILSAVAIPFYMKVKSPELNGYVPHHHHSTNLKAKTISSALEYSLCFMMFFYLGLECTYGGWISSFAVLTDVADS